jgi:hypothetical protein
VNAPVVEVVMQAAVTNSEFKVLQNFDVVAVQVQTIVNVEFVLFREDEHVSEAFLDSACG